MTLRCNSKDLTGIACGSVLASFTDIIRDTLSNTGEKYNFSISIDIMTEGEETERLEKLKKEMSQISLNSYSDINCFQPFNHKR